MGGNRVGGNRVSGNRGPPLCRPALNVSLALLPSRAPEPFVHLGTGPAPHNGCGAGGHSADANGYRRGGRRRRSSMSTVARPPVVSESLQMVIATVWLGGGSPKRRR